MAKALANKLCVVVGGAGSLGRVSVDLFRAQGAKVLSVDYRRAPHASKDVILKGENPVEDFEAATKGIDAARDGSDADLVFCAAGGWAGGSISESYAGMVLDQMLTMNVQSSFLSAHLGARTLGTNGMLVLVGAQAALQPMPSMVAYGMTKAATHHLIRSIAKDPSIEGRWRVAGVLPLTIDTQANRDAMGTANLDSWTPPSAIAQRVAGWVADPATQPATGSLWKVTTESGRVSWQEVP